MDTNTKAPPIGIMPRYVHDQSRFKELDDAILRYRNAGLDPDEELIKERAELLTRLYQIFERTEE